MKLNKLFAGAFVATAMLFASCAKENTASTNNGSIPGGAAAITLRVQGATTGSRVGEYTSETDADAVMTDMVVFIARGSGAKDVSQYYAAAPTTTFTITGTTAASSVYIITNVGATVGNAMAGCSTIGQLKAITEQIDGAGINACVQGNVWMVGETPTINLDTPASGSTPAQMSATVQLYYNPSKIYVEVRNDMTINTGTAAAPVATPLATADPTNAQTQTIIEGVMLMNAGTWTTFVQPDVAMPNGLYIPLRANVAPTAGNVPFFYNGMATWNVALGQPYTDQPQLAGDYVANTALYNRPFTGLLAGSAAKYNNGQVGGTTIYLNNNDDTGTPADITNGFYSFPPIASGTANPKTYVVVYGKYNPDGNGPVNSPTDPSLVQDIFWPVSIETLISMANAATPGSITPDYFNNGHKYIVKIGLTGDSGAGSGGTPDPTYETESADITVTILDPIWVVPTLPEKVFN